MQHIKVTCPKCGTKIDLSQAVEEDLMQKIQSDIRAEIDTEKQQAIADLEKQIEEKNSQLSKSRQIELDLLSKKRELEEKGENIDLEIARRVDEALTRVSQETKAKADEAYRLKISEYENQINGIRKELEAANRKLEQGSQQAQGEAGELDLESNLKSTFPFDLITPVAKGSRGADVHQCVHTTTGMLCGTILWESKNAKNWNDRWLTKLKEDQLAAKADLAVIVSAVLPEDVLHFGYVDGIWITGFPYVLGLAMALREGLIHVAHARRSLEGKDEKIELLYRYLSGPEFCQRIEMIVSTFTSMKTDLESEKRSMTKIWSQRDKSIEKVITNIAGMYGDFQGIVGAALPTISVLELPESI